MELMRIHDLLSELRVGELQCSTLFDPCRRRLGSRDVDLVLAGSGDVGCKAPHDVLFIQDINESVVPLLRNEVSAIGIHTLLQDVGNLMEIRAHGSQHIFCILVRSTSLLLRLLTACGRHVGKRRRSRLTQLCLNGSLTVQAIDLLGEIRDLLFHAVIGFSICGRKNAVLSPVCFEEGLCCLPRSCSLCNQILYVHCVLLLTSSCAADSGDPSEHPRSGLPLLCFRHQDHPVPCF